MTYGFARHLLTMFKTQQFLVVAPGDDTALGHPVEYIKLDSPYPAVCKYCGLRYMDAKQVAKSPEWSHLLNTQMTTASH